MSQSGTGACTLKKGAKCGLGQIKLIIISLFNLDGSAIVRSTVFVFFYHIFVNLVNRKIRTCLVIESGIIFSFDINIYSFNLQMISALKADFNPVD